MSVVQNNTISTNSKTEATSANGVSIDGLKVKDYSLMYGSNIGITIDSNGYVKKPNLPAISVTPDVDQKNYSGDYFISSSVGVGINSTYTGVSNGITLDASNGRFTVPIDGVYLISFYTINKDQNNDTQIKVNGTIKANIHTNRSGSGENLWVNLGGSILWDLNANDYINFVQGATAGDYNFHGKLYGRWSIFLIG